MIREPITPEVLVGLLNLVSVILLEGRDLLADDPQVRAAAERLVEQITVTVGHT